MLPLPLGYYKVELLGQLIWKTIHLKFLKFDQKTKPAPAPGKSVKTKQAKY